MKTKFLQRSLSPFLRLPSQNKSVLYTSLGVGVGAHHAALEGVQGESCKEKMKRQHYYSRKRVVKEM